MPRQTYEQLSDDDKIALGITVEKGIMSFVDMACNLGLIDYTQDKVWGGRPIFDTEQAVQLRKKVRQELSL